MRFEDFVREDQISVLEKLHRRLNQRVFRGKLKKVKIDITLLSEEWAQFRIREDGTEVINIADELAHWMEEMDTQGDQVYELTKVLFPEMVSQYCYEQGKSDQKLRKNQELLEIALRSTEGFYMK